VGAVEVAIFCVASHVFASQKEAEMRVSTEMFGTWTSKLLSYCGRTSLALLMLLGIAGVTFGQTTSGTITGTVVDAKGAAMAGASVAIHNDDTGVDTPTKTNDAGIYTAPLLPPGTYDVTASQTGFGTVEHKSLTLQVGQTLRIDVEMPVASQQSLVTVTTEAPLIETEKTEQSQTVSESLVSDLPTSSRRWEQFVMLTPGVVTDGPVAGMSFHGLNSLYNSNSVDGANNENSYNNAARGAPTNDGYVYSTDSIREFQVSADNFTAELGQAAGGAVNAVTKSGTNNLHGDAFYNMRNPIFNALDPVIKANAAVNGTVPTQSVHQQNQFGGSVGGPALKDKLFYFVTYDGYRKSTPIAYTTSQVSPPISALACPSEITTAQCAAAKSFILNDELGTFPRLLQQDVGLGKVDYQLNQANHVNAVFNWRDWQEPNGTAFASTANSGVSTAGTSYLQNRFVIATWNTLIGGDKVNQVLYQFGQDHSFSALPVNDVPPNVVVTNIFAYGLNGTAPGYANEDRNEISDTFSFEKGRHSFKTGVDLNFIHTYNRTSMNISGLYTYSSGVALPVATGCPTSGGGELFCDWLVDLYGVNVGDGKTGQHWTSFAQGKDQRFPGESNGQLMLAGGDTFTSQTYGGFFQDSWKARPNLTVNLGLRYDVQMLPPETNPNTSLPLLALYTSTVNIDYGGVQPRFGVAWNFKKNSVLRVSFGTYFAETLASTISSARRSTGTREQQFNCAPGATAVPCGTGVAGSGLTFPNVLYAQQVVQPQAPFTAPGLPAAEQPLTPVIIDPAGNACLNSPSCNVRGLSPDLATPRALEGSVAFERQLPGNISFSAAYIVTRGEHEPAFADANLAPATDTKTYDVVSTSGITQQTSTVPFFTQRLAPTTGSILAAYSILNSWYNGLELTFRKPVSHGIEFLANYTLSRATDDGEASYANGSNGPAQELNFNGPAPINPYNWKAEEALSGLNVPNRFAGSVVWEPTYAHNLTNRVERGALDRWSLSTTVTASDGTRYSGYVQGTGVECLTSGSVGGSGSATCVGAPAEDGSMSGAGVTGIGTNYGGRIAWMPRDSYTLPSYSDVDVRLEKQFTVRERYNFDFRAEAFNLLNSTIVQAVNTSAYTYANPSGSTGACPATGPNAHTNTCMVPVSSFQTPTTTTGILLGSRQMQFGFRFEF
jgi:hypothetical protein